MPSAQSSSAPPAAAADDASVNARILAAAERHLFAYGYNALTMDDLAHELGMSKKTLYRHFPGKEEIVDTVFENLARAIRSEMEAVLNEPRLSFAQRLRGVIQVIASRLALASPAMLRELQRYAPRVHQKIDELRQKNIPYVFGRLFRQGIAEGGMRASVDPDFAALFWLQTVRGIVHPETLSQLRLSPAQALEKALDLFAGGLLTAAGRKDYEKLSSR